jgi:hypothetical protein
MRGRVLMKLNGNAIYDGGYGGGKCIGVGTLKDEDGRYHEDAISEANVLLEECSEKPPMVVPTDVKQTNIVESRKIRIVYEDNSTYESIADANGNPVGLGKWTSPGGESRKGTFLDGEFKEGTVVMKLSDSITYEGGYKNGKFNGENGTLRGENNNIILEGTFEDGKFKEGIATMADNPDGSTYGGPIVNGVPSGRGKIVHLNGDYEEGIFEDGSFCSGIKKVTNLKGLSYEGGYEDKEWKGSGYGKLVHGDDESGLRVGDLEEGKFLDGQPREVFLKTNISNLWSYRVYDSGISEYMLPGEPIRGKDGKLNTDRKALTELMPIYGLELKPDSRIKYYFYGENKKLEKTLKIDFDRANGLLSSGGVTDLGGLGQERPWRSGTGEEWSCRKLLPRRSQNFSWLARREWPGRGPPRASTVLMAAIL